MTNQPEQTEVARDIAELICEFNEHLESSSTNVSHTKDQLDANPELAECVRGMGKVDLLEDLRRLEASNPRYQNWLSRWKEEQAEARFCADAEDVLQPAIDEIERLRERLRQLEAGSIHESIRAQSGKKGLPAIMGKWPGDETDEEINRALEEMS